MSIGRNFSAVKDSVMARCLNRTTGTETDLRIAMGSRFRMVVGGGGGHGRCHMTAWSLFYPVFFTVIRNMAEGAKLFSPPSYISGAVEGAFLLFVFGISPLSVAGNFDWPRAANRCFNH
jgi:hypothetical protein